MARDGSYQHQYYDGSGSMVTSELVKALKAHGSDARAASSHGTLEDYVSHARAASLDYLVIPEIQHWEERATEWSGKPDRIEVELTLVEVASGRTLDRTVVSGKSRWMTFGGDHPQELLPVPLAQYADALFQ